MWSQCLPYQGELDGGFVADGELDAPMDVNRRGLAPGVALWMCGSESVGIGVIRAFNGALVQLQPVQGIVVTTTQFTAGACAYARDEGIALVQLRPFTDHDWNGRVRAVKIAATGYTLGEPHTTWEATGQVRPAPAESEDSTGRVSHAVQLPAATTLTESVVAALGAPATVIFHDQLARWNVDEDGVITPRPLI
ncbi:restriction endonuclease [Streptomyces sp. Lzd4kr]|nr:restriction endonuclease [Streptomyces sp. Lzd4kr]